MRFRISVLLTALALISAACGGSVLDDAADTTANTNDQTTTSAVVDAPDATLLSYSLAAGDALVYEVGVTQAIEMTSQSDGGSFAEGGEELPGVASVELTASGTFTFVVAEGPEAGTYEITITGDLTQVSVSGTVDGEPLSGDDIPPFAGFEPVSTTVIVDEQGNPVSEDSEFEDPFAAMFGGIGDPGAAMIPGGQLGQFFGPPFLDEEVTVGDTWSSSFDTPGLTAESITTSVTSTVTGTGTVDGFDVFVVESESILDAFEFDLGQFLIGLFAGFIPDDATEEEMAELDAMMEDLRFVMSFEDSVSTSTTYFDAEAGLTRKFDVSSRSTIGMDVNFPDDTTGGMSGFVTDMSVTQTVTHELVSGPSA